MKLYFLPFALAALPYASSFTLEKPPNACVEMQPDSAALGTWTILFNGIPAVPSVGATTRSMTGQNYVNNVNVEFTATFGTNGTGKDEVIYMTQEVKKVNHKNTLGNQQFRWQYVLNAPLGSKNFWLESNDHNCINKGKKKVPFTYADVASINLYHRT